MAEAARAGVDIGTNSVRLLIVNEDGEELYREMEITRLGQGVDADGRLAAEAIERTVRQLAHYGRELLKWGAPPVRVSATSAARDASNREDFFDAAQKALGTRPKLISGELEAELSFLGATADRAASEGPFLVFDIGGGSTEFVLGELDPPRIHYARSIDIGSVRLSERHLDADPPSLKAFQAAIDDARQAIAPIREALEGRSIGRTLGLAGTVTSVAACLAGLHEYDPTRSHGFAINAPELEVLVERWRSLSQDALGAELIDERRRTTILGGASVLLAVFRELGLDRVYASERDILDGLAASTEALR